MDSQNFNFSLHYFDTIINGGDQDTPYSFIASLDPFQKGPDMSSYTRWLNSGYLEILKIVNDVVLQKATNNENAEINYGIMSQKFTQYKKDPFSQFIGFILPFFIIIAYVCPLCVLVYRMVHEKDTKAKEGMKIMGLSESVYFLSYFLHWLGMNTLYALINSFILLGVFSNVGYIYILGFFWLFGMSVFAMAFFFQAIMDKTRIAIIVTILVYFIMYFISQAFQSDTIPNVGKMFISLLPPTCLQLGLLTLSKFEVSYKKFEGSDTIFRYNNYSVSDMYLMLFIDVLLYLFLGFYLQNVVSHQFGIKRPWNFLCKSSYWCKKNKRSAKEMNVRLNEILPSEKDDIIDVKNNIDAKNFQTEQQYDERLKAGDCLQIKDLKKTFDDGKVAVDGLNLNLYNNEIFALLGHNGAGKSTTISILCGLYEATGGAAMYKGMNILDDVEMEQFRRKLGICPQHDVLFDDLSVTEHLHMFSIFKGVPRSKIKPEIDQILIDVHMTDKKDALAKNLSGGQKRKLSIAIALIGGSEVVFLDEPSSGMDITSRRNLWEILKKCAGNRIIVLTTHYMEEAAVLGNRIGIVSNGKLKCCGNALFLIDRFGKYLSLNVYKLPDADDQRIIEFVKERIPDVEYEILTEEILFRIPKDEGNNTYVQVVGKESKSFSFKNFFTDLDQNMEKLAIKSYGASMPTLEDVFLNVSADTKNKLMKIEDDKENKNMEEEKFEFNRDQQVTSFTKFFTDFKSSMKKRFIQIIRDKKSFFLEVFCPIILVLVGLGLSSVQFINDSPIVNVNINLLPSGQTVFINRNLFSNVTNPISFKDLDNSNVTFNYQTTNNGQSVANTILNFNNLLYSLNYTNSYGSYYILNFDKVNQKYEYILLSNTQSRNAPIIYTQYMTNQILSYATDKKININYSHEPFPLISKIRKQGETRNTSNLVFFVSIAFALIPANFITTIIKERETNTKHLQIISGISLTSYWLSNFVFELVKYYIIGGVCLLIILAFDKFPSWFWLLYILYGFSMTSFTYMFSVFFKTEAAAQNAVILVNFLFGALGGTVIIILRIFEDLVPIGKAIAYILRVVPSFAFAYGYNQLFAAQLLFYVDYPVSFVAMALEPEKNIIKSEYVGADLIYLAFEFVIYLLVLIIWESSTNCLKTKKSKTALNINDINDSVVKSEIEKANLIDETNESKYSIKVKNLEKVFNGGCFSGKELVAVNKLSFCMEFGECFALLGVNGAGKTTTFRALTAEHLPTAGEIYINGMEIGSNFNKVRNLIGYCPQFDAIFDYMSVYENLEFYAKVKGIPLEKVDGIVNSLMKELNLAQYKDKVSGNLSGGNKRKLSVGIAMIGNPPIILLDEPSTGMDPEARRFMWAVIHKISTRSKLSSVILTTHSMEEAETLCRRMGIMVAGQFKCLGTSQYIKDKYGSGFEIDLRTLPMPEARLDEIVHNNNYNINDNFNELTAAESYLSNIRKSNYASLINQTDLGRELYDDLSNKGKLSIKRLTEWTYLIDNTIGFCNKLSNQFDDISIADFYDNNLKIKIGKSKEKTSIGSLFGLLEDLKTECNIAEYSISQTSLEQIFNKFATENDEKVLHISAKKEIKITKELLEKLQN
jgi:ATP-binding cassette, subfamily A (ABC1), member 3